ncbi:hypothetical protein PR048_003333 [Dryococelus australis]|uniref:DUF5641 domain-containing protein n=1 Tax=Dryococelus australis TaxID=614101 RepID=A0ABQ9IMR8_9NEOP|nr:hypothetical protein PR048_003333 [Dryococelus australis]
MRILNVLLDGSWFKLLANILVPVAQGAILMRSAPLNWCFAGVVEVCADRDGLVRMAKVKISSGELKLPTTKLYIQ